MGKRDQNGAQCDALFVGTPAEFSVAGGVVDRHQGAAAAAAS